MNQPNSDGDYLMVEYTHPNRGQHRVIGPVTKTTYGFRGGGERFLVHKDDVAAHPQYFRPIQTAPAKVPLPSHIQDTPPPPPVLKSEVEEPKPSAAPKETSVRDVFAALDEHPVPRQAQVDALAVSTFDLQTLPGITPAIETGLKQRGLDNPDAIIDAGVRGLEMVKYVGETKARMIYEYVVSTYGISHEDEEE